MDPNSDLEGFASGNDEPDIQITNEENDKEGKGEAGIAAQRLTTTFSPIQTVELREIKKALNSSLVRKKAGNLIFLIAKNQNACAKMKNASSFRIMSPS